MKNILIVAGETSGDLHAANLVLALKSLLHNRNKEIRFYGLGGTKMTDAGVSLLEPFTHRAGTGLDPLLNIVHFSRVFRKLVAFSRREKPDLSILIDFPDFNLRLARELKKYNIPVVYYISPQIWAWRKGRIKTIKRYVDKMLVIFEFEKEIYQKAGVPVEFVGHPLLDVIGEIRNPKSKIRNRLGLNPEGLVIGLLPGSRESEFKRHFPIIVDATKIISSKTPRPIKYILGAAPDITPQLVNKMLKQSTPTITPYYNRTVEVITASDLLITVSGTVTVESAILGTPMVVIYRVPLVTELVFSPFIKTPYYAMVNIIAQRKIVPELIQRQCSPLIIAENVLALLQDNKLERMKKELNEVRKRLGQPGASERAAEIIYRMEFRK
ncbi:MAG: lipid-A-disaccharide synthase [Planctomycetota bacterium]|nr:lipid-A-disaccharide synthase [Planctomycetota bacterium]